ncbi:head-tail adaptor protein [Granulicella sp. dw_53]|uniref:head-tail adaptor protein n=1 Tax=Granulicella sp. dw_53 TaxID=2719792 RepID=UPI001BD3BBD4|nr:head-tail adaptor protein [Granulicella sp. dw_53]
MQAGRLNRRIQIQSQTTTQDEFGQRQQIWETAYGCWASLDIQNSALIYSTAEFISKVVTRITMRWTSRIIISSANRVVYVEPTTGVKHTYEIEAVLNTRQGNRELVLMAYELSGSE